MDGIKDCMSADTRAAKKRIHRTEGNKDRS